MIPIDSGGKARTFRHVHFPATQTGLLENDIWIVSVYLQPKSLRIINKRYSCDSFNIDSPTRYRLCTVSEHVSTAASIITHHESSPSFIPHTISSGVRCTLLQGSLSPFSLPASSEEEPRSESIRLTQSGSSYSAWLPIPFSLL